MKEVLKAAGMYALTGIVSAIASRYHLDGSQTGMVMADAVTGVTMAAGVGMHYLAYKTTPPKQ